MTTDLQTAPLGLDNFRFIRELLQREAAIVIEAGKEYLVETRLARVATRNSYASVNALIEQMRFGTGIHPNLISETVDALTTNETLFFRDANPFDALRDQIIPEFCAKRPGATLNIWSAASSTGQEAYSIAMLLADHFPNLSTRIVGTDLSPTVIARARAGLYQQIEVNRGLPAKLLIKYFRQEGTNWQIADSIRQRVEFREMNLIRPWPVLPSCHVVLIRNVMIYFDIETRRQILRQVRQVLAPGGYLGLGGAETTVTVDPSFVPVPVGRATFYQL